MFITKQVGLDLIAPKQFLTPIHGSIIYKCIYASALVKSFNKISVKFAYSFIKISHYITLHHFRVCQKQNIPNFIFVYEDLSCGVYLVHVLFLIKLVNSSKEQRILALNWCVFTKHYEPNQLVDRKWLIAKWFSKQSARDTVVIYKAG